MTYEVEKQRLNDACDKHGVSIETFCKIIEDGGAKGLVKTDHEAELLKAGLTDLEARTALDAIREARAASVSKDYGDVIQNVDFRHVNEVVEALGRKCDSCGRAAFDGVRSIRPPTKEEAFFDGSTVIVVPTRGMISWQIVRGWLRMDDPVNVRKHGPLFAVGYEVGRAYDALVAEILSDPVLSTWKYVLTLEDDNLVPPNAHVQLLEYAKRYPEFDAISGLYYSKDGRKTPFALGNPKTFAETGRLDYEPVPQEVLAAAAVEREPVEVNGLVMGCTLWKMDLFRQVAPPWFVTMSEGALLKGKAIDSNDNAAGNATSEAMKSISQDIYFADKARRLGKRFAVLPHLRVGHLDTSSGKLH